MNENQAAPAPTPVEVLAQVASVIVVGSVAQSSEGAGSIRVERVLVGAEPEGGLLELTWRVASPEGTYGVWFVRPDATPSLLGRAVDSYSAVRSVERVLAGLTPEDSPPSAEGLRDLVSQADAVVAVEYRGSDGTATDVRVLEALKGQSPPEFRVTRGAMPPEPGGPWQFPPASDEWIGYGVLFLTQQGTEWVAINPTDPGLYLRRAVLDVISEATPSTP